MSNNNSSTSNANANTTNASVSVSNQTSNVSMMPSNQATLFNANNETLIASKPIYLYEVWIMNVSNVIIDEFFNGTLIINFNESKLNNTCKIYTN